ncbi:MAG: hypothetical protein GC134_09785 [Proteobacteria bacterium]|nr:hypothetical protein [Pseudomonadota bacterium]
MTHRRTETDQRRDANMRDLYQRMMDTRAEGRFSSVIAHAQGVTKQIEQTYRKNGVLDGKHGEAAFQTVMGKYMSNASLDPEYLDSSSPKEAARYQHMVFDADDKGHLREEIAEQAKIIEQDQQQSRGGGARAIPERVAAGPER